MKIIELYLKDFKLDKNKKCIRGAIYPPDKTHVGKRFYSKGFPNVKGFVVEVFQVRKPYLNPKGFKLNNGDWFIGIHIDQGWDIIESGAIKTFKLHEKRGRKQNLRRPKKLKPGQFYGKFVKVNRPFELSSFDIDIRPGGVEGAGRREHGLPHFHLLKKNTLLDFAKIEIPDIETWSNTKNKISLLRIVSGTCSKSQRKELVKWMSSYNNFMKLASEWNRMNMDNKDVPKIILPITQTKKIKSDPQTEIRNRMEL